MRISDWSSDVCSSDLTRPFAVSEKMWYSGSAVMITSSPGLALPPIQAPACSMFAIMLPWEIGRASCRERVCQYVSISVVAVSLKKKTEHDLHSELLSVKASEVNAYILTISM